MLRATINSTKKYNKFNMATKNTAFLKESINFIFNNT